MDLIVLAIFNPVFAALIVTCVLGLFVALVAALASRKRTRRERDHTPRVRRREGPQVVGFPCAKCGETIVMDPEAAPCPQCGKPIHLACMPHLHSDENAPYRS